MNFDDGESDYERMTRLLQIAEKKNMTLIVTYFDPTPPKSKNQLTNDYNKMCRKELLEAFNNPNSQLYKSFNEKALGLISQFTSIKHKGRYDEKPPLEECEAVDCDVGGLMLFQGTDHIHFREELKDDYYNVLLLHYCSI